LLRLASSYGTPLYVYNADHMEMQFTRLMEAFTSRKPKVFYASKALTNPHVLRHMHSLGAGIDCSSINEVLMALYAGIPSADILYTSNGIAFEEIASAVQVGVRVNIDSISNLRKFGERFGSSYPIGLRLRPNIMAGGNLKISTGHDKSKFGIPVDQLDEVLEIVEQYKLDISGLHIHTGSEIKDVDVFVKGVKVLFGLAPKFPGIRFIDLGGGFKVPYMPGDEGTDIKHLAVELERAFAEFEAEFGREIEVWFEPGKYLVSQAGYFVTTVNVIKKTKAIEFVSVNSGFNHLIRPMFYDSYHFIKNISNPDGEMKPYAVVGNICETDTFAWNRELNEVREGDVLVFYNAGAYGFEMSSNFNSRFRPAEVLFKDGQPVLIRRRETFDDLIKNLPALQ